MLSCSSATRRVRGQRGGHPLERGAGRRSRVRLPPAPATRRRARARASGSASRQPSWPMLVELGGQPRPRGRPRRPASSSPPACTASPPARAARPAPPPARAPPRSRRTRWTVVLQRVEAPRPARSRCAGRRPPGCSARGPARRESVPSAASFSCWRSADSAACAIGAIRRTAVFIAVGSPAGRLAEVVGVPRAGAASASMAPAAGDRRVAGQRRWPRRRRSAPSRSPTTTSTPLMQRDHSTAPSSEHEKRLDRLALDEQRRRRPRGAPRRLGRERRPASVVDAVEQVESRAAGRRSSGRAARYSCTKLTAIEPSPTAEATRFIDWLRTSPATNTPGRLVSSR